MPIDLPTAAQIQAEFQVDARGIVRAPGKFEGQPAYIVWMWELCMHGRVREIRKVFFVSVQPEDLEAWPALAGKREVKLAERYEDGQVYVVE